MRRVVSTASGRFRDRMNPRRKRESCPRHRVHGIINLSVHRAVVVVAAVPAAHTPAANTAEYEMMCRCQSDRGPCRIGRQMDCDSSRFLKCDILCGYSPSTARLFPRKTNRSRAAEPLSLGRPSTTKTPSHPLLSSPFAASWFRGELTRSDSVHSCFPQSYPY